MPNCCIWNREASHLHPFMVSSCFIKWWKNLFQKNPDDRAPLHLHLSHLRLQKNDDGWLMEGALWAMCQIWTLKVGCWCYWRTGLAVLILKHWRKSRKVINRSAIFYHGTNQQLTRSSTFYWSSHRHMIHHTCRYNPQPPLVFFLWWQMCRLLIIWILGMAPWSHRYCPKNAPDQAMPRSEQAETILLTGQERTWDDLGCVLSPFSTCLNVAPKRGT